MNLGAALDICDNFKHYECLTCATRWFIYVDFEGDRYLINRCEACVKEFLNVYGDKSQEISKDEAITYEIMES